MPPPKRSCIECGRTISVHGTRCRPCNIAMLKGNGRPHTSDECSEGGAHHWLIGSPNGTSNLPATCRKCKTERVYAISPEEAFA